MKVTTLVLNADGEPHFKSEDQFDIKNLIEIAKTREQNARERARNGRRVPCHFLVVKWLRR